MRTPISDTGISIAYAPDEGDPLLDIVLVHGLQGHPFRTWASNKASKTSSIPDQLSLVPSKVAKRNYKDLLRRRSSKCPTAPLGNTTTIQPPFTQPGVGTGTPDSGPVFWPGDLAPYDCPRARILVFGYDTKVSKYMAGPTNKNHVMSHGKDLLYALGRERKANRPLVFLAHSLGGIVVKEALAASSVSTESDERNIIESTAAIIFLGTPHRGSPDLSALGEWARIALSIFRMGTTSTILDTLGLKTNDLERAQESFSRLWSEHDFRVKTFQESLGLTGIHFGVLGKKVVPDYSSLLGDQRERAESIQANHMDMCRFTTANDPNYRKVAGELRSIYRSIQELNEQKIHQNGLIQRQSLMPLPRSSVRDDNQKVQDTSRDAAQLLLRRLKFPTMDLRHQSLPRPTDKTCSWLFEHAKYRDWLEGRNADSHRGLLLLRGKPGAGKSVLMKEAYRRVSLGHAESNCAIAAFFFHSQGQELEHSLSGMFRSLLYQILPLYREELDNLGSAWDGEALPLTEEHLKPIFESLFSKTHTRTTFIFIDALDECDSESVRSLAYFWRQITLEAFSFGANLNVLMSIRHFPHVGLSNCPEIKVDHCNRHGITSYIEQKIDLVAMPEESVNSLKTMLVEESRGVFLWVVLMVERMLERLEDGEGLSALLRDRAKPPRKLSTLLREILAPVDAQSKQLTIRLFQWAALTVEPLRLHEWHHVLAFIRRPKFRTLNEWRKSDHFTENDEQLERLIKSLSRGLLEVRAISTPQSSDQEIMSTMAGAGSLDRSNGETRVVEFIHESVREFFLQGQGFCCLDSNLKNSSCAEGHLQIMETCLDYLDISELDALVEARKRLLQSQDHVQQAAQSMERPNTIGSPKRNQAAEPNHRPEELSRPAHAPERQNFVVHSLLESLNALSTTACGIDVGQWVTASQLRPKQRTICESPCSSVACLSTGVSTKVLQDYPALLSYATYKLFSHAKKAEFAGGTPEAIVHRLQRGSWARWLLLSEAKSPEMQLHDFAKSMELTSWCSHLRPVLFNVEDQIPQKANREPCRSEHRASTVFPWELREYDEVQDQSAYDTTRCPLSSKDHWESDSYYPQPDDETDASNYRQADDEIDDNPYNGNYVIDFESSCTDYLPSGDLDYAFPRHDKCTFRELDFTIEEEDPLILPWLLYPSVDRESFLDHDSERCSVSDSVESFGSAGSHGCFGADERRQAHQRDLAAFDRHDRPPYHRVDSSYLSTGMASGSFDIGREDIAQEPLKRATKKKMKKKKDLTGRIEHKCSREEGGTAHHCKCREPHDKPSTRYGRGYSTRGPAGLGVTSGQPEDTEEELLFDMSELDALNRKSLEESRGPGAGSAAERERYDSSRGGSWEPFLACSLRKSV